MAIKTWAPEDRPREKMIAQGASTLSNAELMAILLRSGNATESAVQLSMRLLQDVDYDLAELSKKDAHYFTKKFKGIGLAKAVSIVAALELGRRRHVLELKQREKITTTQAAFLTLFPHLNDLSHEEFWMLCLNNSNKLITKQKIGEGGMGAVVADPKKIFKFALAYQASGIILGHNHPSGNLAPSAQDCSLTKKIQDAGDLLDIKVLDHIIIAEDRYYSFAENNLL